MSGTESQRVNGTTIVIAGGTPGIELAMATRLMREDATVIATRSREPSRSRTEPEVPGEEFILVKAPLLQDRALALALRDGGVRRAHHPTADRMGAPGTAIHAAARGAAKSPVRVLAREQAPCRNTVTGPGPGAIETGFAGRSGMDAATRGGSRPDRGQGATRPHVHGGGGCGGRGVPAFGRSGFVTGLEYVVDGRATEP